ncbi:MAG: hypothetical protein KAJ19_23545, partial [Gammaproteobacteria bacterium]|nr:hypothetical protein [Gammaproteobacteria bacterium]
MYASWAIHNGKVETTKQKLLHPVWFEKIGLPSYGPAFDKISRGTLIVFDDKIRIDAYAGAGTPEDALEYINTIMGKIGLAKDARPVEVFLQGDCLSRR